MVVYHLTSDARLPWRTGSVVLPMINVSEQEREIVMMTMTAAQDSDVDRITAAVSLDAAKWTAVKWIDLSIIIAQY